MTSTHAVTTTEIFFQLEELNIDEPILSRKRRAPRRIEIGESPAEYFTVMLLTITECFTLI